QTSAPNFFFAFNNKTQVTRQFGARFQISFDGFEVGKVLAFVVTGTATVKAVSLDARREWRRFPKFKRLGGLNVIMAVNHIMRTTKQDTPSPPKPSSPQTL